MDEFDYGKPLDQQTKKPIEEHWRKHTLTWLDIPTGQVCFTYKPVVDENLDPNEVKPVPPVLRKY